MTLSPTTQAALPRNAGFSMPAEWARHNGTWIAWPHNSADWPDKFEPIPWVYAEIVKKLHRVERVFILVNDEASKQSATALLQRVGVQGHAIKFYLVPTNRVWTRDYAPFFLRAQKDEIAAVKWRFNAWAKYDNWENDDNAGDFIAQMGEGFVWHPTLRGKRIVLEGGSIDVNGRGTLLTTEECLLSEVQQRNPMASRADLENLFGDYLGIQKTLWLKSGIAGDDTHGHVDDLARFVNPSTIVIASETDPGDANYEPLRENLELLKGMTDQDQRPLTVVPLPMPNPIHFDDQRLPASYANFYIANDLVLVPVFNDERDRDALRILSDCFPDRHVVGIYCGDLVWGLGTLHCMTMQQPV